MLKINDKMIQVYEEAIGQSRNPNSEYNSALQHVVNSLKNQNDVIYNFKPHVYFDDIVRSFLIHSDIITPSEMRVILEAAIDELG